MKKFFLAVFVFSDIVLIAGSGYVLTMYIQRKLPFKPMTASNPVVMPVATSTGTTKLAGTGVEPTPAAAVSGSANVRKMLFTYRNSKPSQVSIRADFTGWKAEPMTRGANGSWTYMAHLTPGEYAYCFTVGDKIINDPANKRTKIIGRTTVSAIVVEAKK